jgi:hypothetical protein
LVITALESSLEAVEAELAVAIADNRATAELARLLQTIYGVGSVTAFTLIADVPELGLLTGKQIAALLGLAPHTRRSGKTRYRATTGLAAPVCTRRCSMPPERRSGTPRHSRIFIIDWSPATGDPAKSRLPRSCANSSSPPTPSLATTNPGAVAGKPRRRRGRAAHGADRMPSQLPVGQIARRAGRVKAAAAPGAVAYSASLDAV